MARRLAPRIIRDPDFDYRVSTEYGAPLPFDAELLLEDAGLDRPVRPARFTPLGPIEPEPLPPDVGEFIPPDLEYDPTAYGEYGSVYVPATGDADLGIGLDPVDQAAALAFENEQRYGATLPSVLEPGALTREYSGAVPGMGRTPAGGESLGDVKTPLKIGGAIVAGGLGAAAAGAGGVGGLGGRAVMPYLLTEMGMETLEKEGVPARKFSSDVGTTLAGGASAAIKNASNPAIAFEVGKRAREIGAVEALQEAYNKYSIPVVSGALQAMLRPENAVPGVGFVDFADLARMADDALAPAAKAMPDLLSGSRASQRGQVPVNPFSELGKGADDAGGIPKKWSELYDAYRRSAFADDEDVFIRFDRPGIAPGTDLPPSRLWDDGEPTDDVLAGTSVIDPRSSDMAWLVKDPPGQGTYDGIPYLVRNVGYDAQSGDDPAEAIIKARVIGPLTSQPPTPPRVPDGEAAQHAAGLNVGDEFTYTGGGIDERYRVVAPGVMVRTSGPQDKALIPGSPHRISDITPPRVPDVGRGPGYTPRFVTTSHRTMVLEVLEDTPDALRVRNPAGVEFMLPKSDLLREVDESGNIGDILYPNAKPYLKRPGTEPPGGGAGRGGAAPPGGAGSAEAAGNITPPFNRTLPTEQEVQSRVRDAVERKSPEYGSRKTATIEPPDDFDDLVDGAKERGVARTIRTSELADPRLRQELTENPITYNPITNAATRAEAEALIARNIDEARSMLADESQPLDALVSTVGQLLIKRAQAAGDIQAGWELTDQLARRATKSGQGIQALNMFSNWVDGDNIGLYIQKFLHKAAQDAKNERLKAKLTLPKLREFQVRASGIGAMPEGRDKLLSMAVLQRDIHELVPASFWRQVSTALTMAQLLTFKTFNRNIIGNAMFAGAEQFSRAMAVLYDVPLSVVTGKRSVVGPQFGAQVRGFKQGLREGFEETMLGVNLKQTGTQYDLGSGATRTFRSGPGSALETLLNLELQVPDRAFYQAAVEESLLGQATVIAMNEGLKGAERSARVLDLLANPTKQMQEIAHQDGLFRTFQDNNLLSNAAVTFKNRVLNLGQEFGAGDFLLKYPKTPANLLVRAMDYGPTGAMNALIDLARSASPIGHKTFDQRAFVEKLGRATVGTVGLTMAGMALTHAGVLTGRADKDKDVRALQQSEGLGPYRFNVDGFKRWVASGFTEVQKPERGDTFISYDWAAPLSVALAVGAEIAGKQQGLSKAKQRPEGIWDALSQDWLGVLGGGVDALAATVDTIASQPMVRGVQQVFGGRSAGDTVVEVMKAIPSSFVPTMLSQINQAFNNTMRETYSPDAVMEALNGALAKLPALANILPDRLNVWGEPQDRYWQDTNNPFNVFVNPAFVTQYIPRPEAEMLMELQRATGETSMLPRVAGHTMKVDGVTYQLTEKEYIDYQGLMGRKVREAFGNLAQNPAFRNQPPAEQVEMLAGLLTKLNVQAKEELRLRASLADPGSGAFLALDPLKGTKGERVTEQNINDYVRDKPLLDAYESVADRIDEQVPAYAKAKQQRDALSGADRDRFEMTNLVWKARQKVLEREREKLRRDPAMAQALYRWSGIGKPVQPSRPVDPRHQALIDRAKQIAAQYKAAGVGR